MKSATCLAIVTSAVICTGCAQSLLNQSLMEQRVIEQFAEAINEENEPALRRITSSRFEEKAMRSDDVLSDLQVLPLPKDRLTVVEVTNLKDGGRQVIAKEESGGKYQFRLVNDPAKNYWVVDDVMVRQLNKSTRITKSTTEVMDLLMTLRQFLTVWESGERHEILAMTSPGLTSSLERLPDEWLQALTARIASTYEDGMARRPEANLNENDAVVKLPAKNGHLLIKIVRSSGEWLVDDVEAHNHRDKNHSGSVRRQADAVGAVNSFLTAYGAEDHDLLQQLTTNKFYADSLKLADLSIIQLPSSSKVPDEFDIRTYENKLTVMLPAGREIVRLDLEERQAEFTQADIAAGIGSALSENEPRFLVRDVTLYERATQRQKSLSSVFTAPTRASFFLKALSERDHETVSQMSSAEFSRATWERLAPEILAALPIPDFYDESLTLTDSHTVAQRTELEFRTGNGSILSCRMVTENGALKVDDIQYPNQQGQVTSLRTRLELAAPLLEFATAWHNGDMQLLQKACSSDFNRLVWSNLEGVPTQFPLLAAQLRQPIRDTRVTQERATVRLGSTNQTVVSANLIMEHNYWVVDEIHLDQNTAQHVGVREKLRGQIAARLLSGSYSTVQSKAGYDVVRPMDMTPPGFDTISSSQRAGRSIQAGRIQQASAEFSSHYNQGVIDQAVYERPYDEQQTSLANAPVSHAVYTREYPSAPPTLTTPGAAGDVSHRPPSAHTAPASTGDTIRQARSASGFEVFGPQADRIAESFDTAASAPRAADLADAIDMTPDHNDRPVSGDSASTKGLMYFGPDRAALSNEILPPDSGPSAAAPQHVLTQPADMPIAIQ
ncbi:MAG: hypothetical protein GY903_08795 [Fuerstiella sp.]|nr:hypothetical protein [Fuerstiella sp.]MCP4854578.1 hypothetical protein [Fuerstiella sp.]